MKEITARVNKYMTVETSDKLYLYATDIVEREKRDHVSRWHSLPRETAKPLTKREALSLAHTLIRFADRKS